MTRIAIIGAGASGLFLTKKLLEHADCQVYVFERCRNVGTKLRASGGGKANLFNEHIDPDGYNHPNAARQLLQQVSPARLRESFEQMGLTLFTDEEGRVYPSSQFSQTVVDLLWEPERENCHAILEHEVKHLENREGKWHIDDFPVAFDHVVLASGTPANMISKNRKEYNRFLDDLSLTVHPFQPSLVGFTIEDYPKFLAGCRTRVIADLWQGDRLIHREAGEVTFKEDGISGIVILNLSAYYNRLPSKENCFLQLNLIYHDEHFNAEAHWQRFHTLKGVLHPKLNALYEQKPFDVNHFRLKISGTYAIDFAQVCHGGIDLQEVNPDFSLKRFPGLYATGEMLDMDGICGGYNLFFAFASALIAYQTITCKP